MEAVRASFFMGAFSQKISRANRVQCCPKPIFLKEIKSVIDVSGMFYLFSREVFLEVNIYQPYFGRLERKLGFLLTELYLDQSRSNFHIFWRYRKTFFDVVGITRRLTRFTISSLFGADVSR